MISMYCLTIGLSLYLPARIFAAVLPEQDQVTTATDTPVLISPPLTIFNTTADGEILYPPAPELQPAEDEPSEHDIEPREVPKCHLLPACCGKACGPLEYWPTTFGLRKFVRYNTTDCRVEDTMTGYNWMLGEKGRHSFLDAGFCHTWHNEPFLAIKYEWYNSWRPESAKGECVIDIWESQGCHGKAMWTVHDANHRNGCHTLTYASNPPTDWEPGARSLKMACWEK